MSSNYQQELGFARYVARQAGRKIRQRWSSGEFSSSTKGDGTAVTSVDIEVDRLVAELIKTQRPKEERLLSEEDAATHRSSGGRRWVCDPLDGTWLFKGRELCSVFSLALVVDHEPVIGVVAEPQTDTLFWAAKGEGAYLSDDEGDGPSRLEVSEHAFMQGASLSLPGSPNEQIDNASLIKNCLDKGAEMVTTGSAVYDAIRVATGFVSADVYPYVSCWDMAAAALIVQEAGGVATDLHGRPLQLDKDIAGAVLSNGYLHDELLSIVSPLIKK